MGGRGASSSNINLKLKSSELKKGDIIGDGAKIINVRKSTIEKDGYSNSIVITSKIKGKTSTIVVDKDTTQSVIRRKK